MPSLSSVKGPPQQGFVAVNPEGSWTCLSHQAPAGSIDCLTNPHRDRPTGPCGLEHQPQLARVHGAGPTQTSQLTVRHLFVCQALSAVVENGHSVCGGRGGAADGCSSAHHLRPWWTGPWDLSQICRSPWDDSGDPGLTPHLQRGAHRPVRRSQGREDRDCGRTWVIPGEVGVTGKEAQVPETQGH